MIRLWAAVAALGILLAACGGDDDDDEPEPTATREPLPTAASTLAPEPTQTPGATVSADQALKPVADAWAAQQSMTGRFIATADLGSQTLVYDGDLRYRAPDQRYIEANFFGRPIEFVAYGENHYINTDEGWKSVDYDALGVNLSQLSTLSENRGFFDLQRLVAALDSVEVLADEEIQDVAYTRYRASAEVEQIADQLPGVVSPQVLAQADEFIESLQFDFWVAKDSNLPRRVLLDVKTPGGGRTRLEMAVDYTEYGAAVEIPPEPVGVPQLQDSDFQ